MGQQEELWLMTEQQEVATSHLEPAKLSKVKSSKVKSIQGGVHGSGQARQRQ